MEESLDCSIQKILDLILNDVARSGKKMPKYVMIPGKHPHRDYDVEVGKKTYRACSAMHETGKDFFNVSYVKTQFSISAADGKPPSAKRQRNK